MYKTKRRPPFAGSKRGWSCTRSPFYRIVAVCSLRAHRFFYALPVSHKRISLLCSHFLSITPIFPKMTLLTVENQNHPLTLIMTKVYKSVMTMIQSQVFTISDLARLENVHYMTVYKWVRNGAFGEPNKLPRSSGKFYLIPQHIYTQWVKDGRPKYDKNNNNR